MAQANISLLSTTSIHSYSSQDSANPWSNLLDGSTSTNGRSARANPSDQWIIIDLGSIWPLVGFKLWNSTFSFDSYDVSTYKIDVSTTGVDDGNFVEVVPETYIFSQDPFFAGGGGVGTSTRAIPATDARYVRLYLLDNNGDALYIAASNFEIYSLTIEQITTQILSNATIFLPTETKTITSDAFLYKPVYTDSVNITSDAEITHNKADILSDAWIVGNYIFSDAIISKTELTTITTDAYIYQSGSFTTDILLFGRANVVNTNYNMLVYSTDISSSGEVISKDMITGDILDMTTVTPPLGYNNYDWKYDWVVRTFNKCQYKFEIRAANDLLELSAEPFHEIQLDEQIYKGQVNRYYQWRCHVWASGSGDFELHQFTIKGYVDYPANPLYRTLREKPFITTSHIRAPGDVFTTQQYEPSLTAMAYLGPYLPMDLNNDWNINSDDINLFVYIYIYYPGSTIAAPGFNVRGLFTDTNGHTTPTITDLTQLINYIYLAGPPPSRQEEPI